MNNSTRANIESSIIYLLHQLGVPSHIKGYRYLKEGINIMYFNPEEGRKITKKLYPDIANKFDTTNTNVERSIRHAIELGWNRGNYKLIEEIFGYSIDIERSKPTNSEFIITVADKLRLENMI